MAPRAHERLKAKLRNHSTLQITAEVGGTKFTGFANVGLIVRGDGEIDASCPDI